MCLRIGKLPDCLNYTGRRGRGMRVAPHVPPQKTLKNLVIKMQWSTKIEDPQRRFPHNPKYPSKEFENDCASMKLHLIDCEKSNG
jgi:hypothetical protein